MSETRLPTWTEVTPGGIVREPGSTLRLDKNGWRVEKPVIDPEKCVRCRLCWIYCPDTAILEVEEPYTNSKGRTFKLTYKVDYDRCKGCGICAEECPVDAIEMVPEEVA